MIARHLNFDFLNDAVSGGTNDRAVYKTLQAFGDYDYFFIAWTSYARFTEYNPVDNFEINFTPQLNLEASVHYSDDLKKNYSKYKKYGEMYYKYWYNALYEFKKWLQQIILLQSFFETHKKKYLMINTMQNDLISWLQPRERFIESCHDLLNFFDYLDDEQLLREHQKIQGLVTLIDQSKFVSWKKWCITDLKKTHICGPGGHILESGHQEVAKKVLEHYNQTR